MDRPLTLREERGVDGMPKAVSLLPRSVTITMTITIASTITIAIAITVAMIVTIATTAMLK